MGSGARRAALAGRGGRAGPVSWAGLGPRGQPVGCDSPKVHGSLPEFFFRQVTASLTLLDHSLLHASFDRVHENISLFAAKRLVGNVELRARSLRKK